MVGSQNGGLLRQVDENMRTLELLELRTDSPGTLGFTGRMPASEDTTGTCRAIAFSRSFPNKPFPPLTNLQNKQPTKSHATAQIKMFPFLPFICLTSLFLVVVTLLGL